MSKFNSISTIRNQIKKFAKLIDVPPELLIVRSTPDGFGAPHIEVKADGYHFIITERGEEYKHKHTINFDQLLYWIMDTIIFTMAINYELDHRQKGLDSRRNIFAKELDLMEKINPQWKQWKAQEIDEILIENPYNDELYF